MLSMNNASCGFMYQDSDEDQIVKHILCADTHVSPKYEHNAFIYTLIYDIYMRRKRLMHRDSDIEIPHYVHTLLIKHTMSRKIDEPT